MHFSDAELLILTLLFWKGGVIPVAVAGLVIAGIAYLAWRLIRFAIASTRKQRP